MPRRVLRYCGTLGRPAVRKDHDGQPVIVGRDLSNPSDTAASLITLLQDEPSEVFAILCLSTKHRVIAYCARHAIVITCSTPS